MHVLNGIIALPGGMVRGTVRVDGDIASVEPAGPYLDAPDDDAPRILPGFVDVHVHGGAGGDAMDGPDGVRTLARHHARQGSTTLLPTTITAPWERVLDALRGIAEVRDALHAGREPTGLPDLPGAHLEGPFLNPERLGAQPPHALEPGPDRVREVLARDVVRLATIAPELPGALEAIRLLARAGVRVSVGHTRATAEQVAAAARVVRDVGGTIGFTHLYNAMGGMAGREPGVVGACFADREAYAELILDGHHVDATAFLAAWAAKGDRLHLVTDAMRACGLPEGTSELGGQPVTVRDGAARLANGGLAGSVLTMAGALRNAVGSGVPLARAAAMASTVPARYLGMDDRGTIRPGLRADLVVLDADLAVRSVWIAGREVHAG